MTQHSRIDNPIHNNNNEVDIILYKKMLKLSQSAIICLDADFRVLSVSESIAILLGYEMSSLIGKSYIDLIALEYQDTFRKLIVASNVVQFDYPLLNKEGVLCWVHHSGEINLDSGEAKYEFLIQNVSDYKRLYDEVDGKLNLLTEQKEAQQKLTQSEARHRTLLEALPDLMFVVKRDGIITEFRSTPEVEALGIDESVIGKKFTEAGFPQPLVDEVQLYMDIGLESQYVQSFEFGGEKTSILDHSKSTYYEARLVRLNDDEIMALVRNVTQLKRVQEELNRHINDLTIVRQVNVELSANLNMNYVSQLALDAALRLSNAQAGYLVMVEPSGALSRMSIFGLYDVEKLDAMFARSDSIISRVIKLNKPELILDVHSDPNYIPLLENTQSMIVVPLNSNERIVGILVLEARNSSRFSLEQFEFLQLITGRIAAFLDNASLYRQTQDQLEELTKLYQEVQYLEQLKTDMIRIASHDLKNPLGSIMGYMQMFRLDAEEKLNAQERNYLDKIEVATAKMERIIKGILSLERIQQLSERQTRATVDLRDLAYKCVSEYVDFSVRNEQQLKRYLPEHDVFIDADALQIYEALSNLVHNALKYTPRHGAIDVSLSVEGNLATFRVKDTGYGIPEHLQARLFNPFYRADTIETRFIEGTGLGLHLVKNIIERHHGVMVFESVYGEGSTFGFDIPVNVEPSQDDKKALS